MAIKSSLLQAYIEVYFFINNEIDFSEFAVVTAWNPFSVPVSNKVNRSANSDLRQHFVKQNYEKLLVGDINREWVEESFAVELPIEQAVQLGRRFRQNAIYYVRNDVLSLVSCIDETAKENEFSLFSQRTRRM